ncbi:TraX family protein [Xanthomonas cucurbitae]|uniref:Conjugal transfer protein n=1 Tax=Xanthomonas cucurbitae TaxID=56453 RepID=A0A2S7DIN4_9XANT|nr:TraX family protein [Xanthomonas cucurbitae]PPU73693.1 conjugal transfer protein [Xanthomonas cucurbitae]WDM69436.1 conjugal transfer protein [Xanthomonas cucurbitae]WDM73309.1 conjugal transfer protein [Xanthomonas cucurbitae]WDM77553.1 conjugal transfer protein [Xanthomonas cucurbitae]WDM81229.1 conjugal transfer protein [Xanthomonas cucurbitae]
MTSGGREFLKWLAVVFMTGDHALKVLAIGYVPVVAELGRAAFPLFALVLAYNLAQPGADIEKSVKRLFVWGVIATPVTAIAFQRVFPLNVLLSFALAAACILAIQRGRWIFLALCAGLAPAAIEYNWSGLAIVLGGWMFWRNPWQWRVSCPAAALLLLVLPVASLYYVNGNAWALLALPLLGLAALPIRIPRTRRAFYIYYVGHLMVLTGWAYAWADRRLVTVFT